MRPNEIFCLRTRTQGDNYIYSQIEKRREKNSGGETRM